MMDVSHQITILQRDAFAAVTELEARLKANPAIYSSPDKIISDLTDFSIQQATRISDAWRDMLPDIIAKCVFPLK